MLRTCVFILLLFSFQILAAPRAPKVLGRVYVIRNTSLWSEPTSYGQVVMKIKKGTPVEILSSNTGSSWAKVTLANGSEGYLLTRNLAPTRPSLTAQDLKQSPKRKSIRPRNPASEEQDEPSPMVEDVPLAPPSNAALEEESVNVIENDFADDTPALAPVGNVYENSINKLDAEETSDANYYIQDDAISKKQTETIAKDPEFMDEALNPLIALQLEWADQFSHDHSLGWGAGLYGLYPISDSLMIGFIFMWDRFKESASDNASSIKVTRSASKILIGPLLRYQNSGFFVDGALGWDRTTTNFNVVDSVTGANLLTTSNQNFVGKYTDNALGVALRGGYSLDINDRVGADFYLGYGLGFYGGESAAQGNGHSPQQLMIGAALKASL